MKAIVKNRPLPGKEWPKGIDILDRPEPALRNSGDVKLKVTAAAICGTDVGIYNSKDSLRDSMVVIDHESIIIGHEFCGKIVDAGEGAKKILAEKVASTFTGEYAQFLPELFRGKNAGETASMKGLIDLLNEHFYATSEMHVTCGKCLQCRRNEKHACMNTIIKGIHEDGCFTSYVTVPAENIVLFGINEIAPEIIAFMDALGNATHTVQAADVKGKRIAVLGCGVQGLMATAVAKYAGAEKIFVTDVSHGHFSRERLEESRFTIARDFGADFTFNVAIENEQEHFYQTVLDETEGAGVDAVLEMSGNYKAYEDAFQAVRMGGMVALLGIPAGRMAMDYSRDVIFRGITVHGVIGRRIFETWDMMRTILHGGLAKKLLDPRFITHDIPITEIDAGVEALINGDALKVLLRP